MLAVYCSASAAAFGNFAAPVNFAAPAAFTACVFATKSDGARFYLVKMWRAVVPVVGFLFVGFQ